MRSWQFEFFFAAVLVSNAIFLGVQTEWAAIYLNKDLPAPFTIVHSIYAILFVAELMWRVSLSGCRTFLCSSDWAWHWLDIAVTFSAVFDVIATLAGFAALTGGSNSGFRLLRVMKIARLVRVIRIIKVGSKKLRMYPKWNGKDWSCLRQKTKIRGAKDESEARGYWWGSYVWSYQYQDDAKAAIVLYYANDMYNYVYMFAVFVLFVWSITEHANAERSQSIKDTLLEDHSPLPATIHLDRSCGLCGPWESWCFPSFTQCVRWYGLWCYCSLSCTPSAFCF